MIDHTLLKPDASEFQIIQLCSEALEYNFKSVCINPIHIKLAAHQLRDSSVLVDTVCGFPLGAVSPEVKVYEAEYAENQGAQEIDLVANIGAIKDDKLKLIKKEITAVRKALMRNTILKVIIECGLLTEGQICESSKVIADCGADFVKTSTGFFDGATIQEVTLLYNTVGKKVKIKAAGGIRDLKTALSMIEAGASRIGTSSGVKIIEEFNKISESG